VEAVIGAITETLQKGDTVALSGFGSFVAKERAARTAAIPYRGAGGHRMPAAPPHQGWQGAEGCTKLARFLARPGA